MFGGPLEKIRNMELFELELRKDSIMDLIKWDESLSVGIVKIDDQHRKLIRMINDLNLAMNTGKSRKMLGSVLSDMIEYAQIHFQTEEEYFARYNYVEKSKHEREHGGFISKVFDFNEKFDQNKEEITTEVLDFLSNWLVNHIKGSDMKYKGAFE